MRFFLSLKYTLLAFFLFVLELVIFMSLGDCAGEIFDWIYRSLGAVYVSVILALVAFAIVSSIIFPFLQVIAQNSMKQFILYGIAAPTVAMFPFWCAWFRPLFDTVSDLNLDQHWLGATAVLVASMFSPFYIALRNFFWHLAHNNRLDGTSDR